MNRKFEMFRILNSGEKKINRDMTETYKIYDMEKLYRMNFSKYLAVGSFSEVH